MKFMAVQPAAVVVMKACGSSSYWAREMIKMGHEVKLIAPQYVKPFVKRQKNDAADAEAIVDVSSRLRSNPTIRGSLVGADGNALRCALSHQKPKNSWRGPLSSGHASVLSISAPNSRMPCAP